MGDCWVVGAWANNSWANDSWCPSGAPIPPIPPVVVSGGGGYVPTQPSIKKRQPLDLSRLLQEIDRLELERDDEEVLLLIAMLDGV